LALFSNEIQITMFPPSQLLRIPSGEFGSLVRAIFPDLHAPTDEHPAPAEFRLPVVVYYENANAVIRAELPGVLREDIAVEVSDQNLVITATRKEQAAGLCPKVTLTRTLPVPEEFSLDNIGATYANGVLTVTLAKREVPAAKRVAIEVK
jgi:HSP20 family protein